MAKSNNKSNKARYDSYKNSGRKIINKEKKKLRHEKRMAKFAKRKENGKTYTYKANPFPKDSEAYIKEQNERSLKNKGHKTDFSKFVSIMAKLQNKINKAIIEEKKAERNNKKDN